MTFTIKVRTSPGAPMLAEYECPVHGVMTLQVRRDEHGDPPAEMPCPTRILRESITGMELADPGDAKHFANGWCGLTAAWRISAPAPRRATAAVEVLRGKSEERPPGAVSTQRLGEGATVNEWRKAQRADRQERRHHQLIAKGLKTKRVQV